MTPPNSRPTITCRLGGLMHGWRSVSGVSALEAMSARAERAEPMRRSPPSPSGLPSRLVRRSIGEGGSFSVGWHHGRNRAGCFPSWFDAPPPIYGNKLGTIRLNGLSQPFSLFFSTYKHTDFSLNGAHYIIICCGKSNFGRVGARNLSTHHRAASPLIP